ICPCTLGNGRVGSTVLFTERNTEKPSPAAGIPAYTAELEELTDQLSLLAETTTVLTSTLDLREALRRLVQLVVPRLADWAIVDLFGEDDDLVGSSRQLRRVAVAHGKGGEHVRRAEFEGPLPPVT